MPKLGKKPAQPRKKDLLFEDFVDRSVLPKRPTHFGHELLVGAGRWGMLGNDSAGDCVWAGAAHETMLWNEASSSTLVPFTDQAVLSDYSAVTGYDPKDPNTDQGTDVHDAANYRLNTGIIDAGGRRHKIGAFVALDPGNLSHLYEAMYLFGAVGIGIEFPDYAMDQFNNGEPWAVKRGGHIDGGHYIPLVAKRTDLDVITWAKVQQMTSGFYKKYCDEAYAYISPEYIGPNGKTIDGFDTQALTAALNALRSAR